MTSRRDDGHGDLFHPDSAMDEVFAHANPNPERTGCPSDEVLQQLASRQRPIADPAYEHLAQCSPCYRTFRAFQREQRSPPHQAHRHAWRWPAAAVVAGLAVLTVWFVRSNRQGGPPRDTRDVQMQMDLRNYAVARRDTVPPPQPPLPAMRARLDLTLLLPVGSEAGDYDLQVLDATERAHRSATGEARIENHVTTLRTHIDLRGLTSGTYRLALRRRGEDWRVFPLRIE